MFILKDGKYNQSSNPACTDCLCITSRNWFKKNVYNMATLQLQHMADTW